MQLFNFKDVAKSWSTWAFGAIGGLATVDLSTTWLNSVIPEHYKPAVYAVLAAIGVVVRTIKQPKLSN
nr:MAG TPA: hypothetical protein [Bacteriophage sp.]